MPPCGEKVTESRYLQSDVSRTCSLVTCLTCPRVRTVHCVYYNPGSGRAAELAQLGGGRGVRCVELSRPGLDSLCRQADRCGKLSTTFRKTFTILGKAPSALLFLLIE